MSAYSLIVCVVPHGGGEVVTTAARKAGSPGGTVIMARSFSKSTLLQLFSLGDKWEDVVLVLVPSEMEKRIYEAIVFAARKTHRKFGTMFMIEDIDTVFKSGNAAGDVLLPSGGEEMGTEYKLITVIANKGYADDIMAAARAAGAGGGTVMNARGTAKAGDTKFLGLEIVPEKDLLEILTASDKTPSILEAIRTLPCLSKPGSGIAFCVGASNFTLLGNQ